MPERCNTLWIGPALGAVERACLLSVMRHGHRLRLYCYAVPDGVPKGVEICDAAEILPEERIIRHKSGSAALFANWFRYRLQEMGRGLWIDTDIYLLAPIEAAGPTVMGEEEPGVLNTAVLRLPPESPLLPELLALFEENSVPPWLKFRHRLRAQMRLLITGRSGLAMMPWGSAGPNALTALATRHGLCHLALPREVFYPVHWRDADWIRNPAIRLEDRITPDTVAIHLWNERIRQFKDLPAPSGSFLARLQEEGARE